MAKIQKTDEEWRTKLSPEEYEILRKKGTEPAFSGKLLHNTAEGTYKCAACGASIFRSDTKFDSGSGWPSFYDAIPGSVEFKSDNSHFMQRTEISCANCGSHLGHIFDDAPDQPTGKRYCVNSLSLDFVEKTKK